MAGLTQEQGAYLVSLARRAIKEHFKSNKRIMPDKSQGVFSEKRGVFVTLQTYPAKELRGCIGYPMPVKELALSVVDSALSASFEDPRFSPLSKEELENIVIEVSVLSVPEEIKVKSPKDFPKKIKVGRDGLIVHYGYSSGLLLPQVPIEWNWDEREFLCQACIKAGLPREMWLSPSVKISRFEAQVFSEQKPEGKVELKRLIR